MSRNGVSLRHEIGVERPAFEKRHDDPRRDYGIGCVMMSFASIGEHGAVALTVFTGWYLPHVAERLRKETRHKAYGHDPTRMMLCSLEGHGGAVEIHSDHALFDSQPEPDTDECRFTSGKCWGDTGFTAGETLFDVLVEKGQDALFAELDSWYWEHVGQSGVRRQQRGRRCSGITATGGRCKRRWRTADPGLSRKPYYCEQHRDQRGRNA